MKKAVSVLPVWRQARTGAARVAQRPFMYNKQEQAGRMQCVQPDLYSRVCC